MFIDVAKIYLKSGKGGDGHVSFRRELYVPNGGPDGGDGGKGGDIIFEIDKGLNTLLSFKNKYKYIAESGENGKNKRCHGKNGKDLIIKVPNGTIIKDTKTNKIIYDMTDSDSSFTILKGGKGGLGNMHFVTSVMQAPRYAKPGESATELFITLELKVLADVGLVGFPNVGKSTLISKLTNARPEINNYHFTTLNPHLGVCKNNNFEFIIADIPGIIEGASEGIGLGFKFLKHIERTKVLAHVIDIAGVEGRDPLKDLEIIFNELNKYDINLSKKKQIIIANKIDSIDEANLKINIDKIKNKYKNFDIFPISCFTSSGLENLKNNLTDIVKNSNIKMNTYESEISIDELKNNDNSNINIKIEKINNDKYYVYGEKIKKMLGYTNLDTEKGMNFFQKFLVDEGIIKSLKKLGMKEGDTVKVLDMEFTYYD